MDKDLMQEVRDLIRFYDRNKWDWTLAVEFTLWRASEDAQRTLDRIVDHPLP